MFWLEWSGGGAEFSSSLVSKVRSSRERRTFLMPIDVPKNCVLVGHSCVLVVLLSTIYQRWVRDVFKFK